MQKHNTKNIATHAALERILNVYFRENGQYRESDPSHQWTIQLNEAGKLMGQFSYWSPMGHHMYENHITLHDGDTVSQLTPVEGIQLILEKMVDETDEDQSEIKQRLEAVQTDIDNSIERTACYLAFRESQHHETRYIQSEQSLYLGHPFHPTPKSATGFSQGDIQSYAPECHVSFQLFYIAVHQSLLLERYVTGHQSGVDTKLHKLSKIPKSDIGKDFKLLAVHPFQIDILKQNGLFKVWCAKGLVRVYGPCGDEVYPTSSVRTVFAKHLNFYLKLPIQVKITNFVRTNDFEQIERTLDAAEIIATVKRSYETAAFKLMFEEGYRAFKADSQADSHLLENSAMIVREGIESYQTEQDIHVLASLVETLPDNATSLLSQRIEQSGLTSEAWLADYLNMTLRPMLKLFSETGISLEAHVQNTLIALKQGRPHTCYVRDLEGICVSRELAQQANIIPNIVREESPVVLSHQEAWHRFKYYIIVNQLGHLISTIGKAYHNESQLWSVVREQFIQWQASGNEVMQASIQYLCDTPFFEAKANLTSKLKDCGENPIYIEIPNPIFIEKEDHLVG
nr:IucA/IucC family protein [Staphylococcus schleiferi]